MHHWCCQIHWIHFIQEKFRFIFEMHKNGKNVNIFIRGFILWKQKIPVKQCYPTE